jgi:hypothetical protein
MNMPITDVHEIVQKPVEPLSGAPSTALPDTWPIHCWSKEQQEIIERYGYTSHVQVLGGKTEGGEMVLVIGNIKIPPNAPGETR